MAAAGGGKIRTRRYHIASKPYAKGNQQPGLISRMTDTVKSIVPSWLQRYFRNGEAADRDGSVLGVEPDSQAPLANNNEEALPHEDGQASPEPSTSHAEPSTSRAALNFQDILARPPLSRSHLHFPSLDGSPGSPFTQPSTSSTPFPGVPFTQPSTSSAAFSGTPFTHPSTSSAPFSGASFTQPSTSSAHFHGGSANFSLVKEIKDTSSQHEDDNISTTSGFSSRASDKDVTTSKPASLPLLWSPENDRSHSGPQQSQAALKKPSFNLSVFGTSSASLSNSVVNSSQLGDSPFYPGKTTYGGAAAARSSARAHPGTPYRAPVRRQVKAKPAGAQACGVTSATARRILLSLERMSSPLASLDRTELDTSPFQSKRKKIDPTPPPTQKLLVPAAASVAGNRSMSFRPSLTPAGSVGRVADRRSTRDTSARQSTRTAHSSEEPPGSTSHFAYPLSSTPAANSVGSGAAGGKMKRERSTRPSSKQPEDQIVEAPELPAISLPISTFTLPTFSFSSPPPASGATPAVTAPSMPLTSKAQPAASSPPCVPFTFSSPIVKATATSPPSLSPSASGFTFSVPVPKAAPSNFNGKADNPVVTPVKSISGTAGNKATDNFEGPFKPAKVLKQGSVLDILKAPGFSSSSPMPGSTLCPDSSLQPPISSTFSTEFGIKPSLESWNCTTCLEQNGPSDSKCVACSALRPSTDLSSSISAKPDSQPTVLTSQVGAIPSASFGSLFALPVGTWECDTCLVQNKPDVVRCVACETAKPGTGVKPGLTLPAFSETSTAPTSSSSSTTVTAPITSSITSSSTTTSLSSGFLGFEKFKKPEGAWECGICLVENKAQDTKCVACQNPKPGAPMPPSSTTSTSLPPAGALLGFGDKFKPPEGSWECQACSLQNKADDLQCIACQGNKPGTSAPPKVFASSSSFSSPFTFGIQSSSSTNSTAPSGLGNFKFGTSSTDTTSSGSAAGGFTFSGPPGGFKFGSNSSTLKPEEDKKAETQGAGSGFKFGVSGGIVFGSGNGTGSSSGTAANGESKAATGVFSFGLAKAEEKTSTGPSLGGAAFVFSAPKGKPEMGGSASTEPAAATTSFTFGKPQEVAPAADQTKPVSVLSQSVEKNQGASSLAATLTPAFTFGKVEEKQDNTAPSAGFLFSSKTSIKELDKTTPSTGFSFSKPDPPKEQSTPTFTFGKPAEKTETEPPKVSFSFGVTSADSGASKPSFGFMASSATISSSSSTSSSTTTTTPACNLFGSSSSAGSSGPAPASTGTFLFGQSASTEAAPAKTFVFGQQQDSQPVLPTPQNAPAVPAPTAAQPFLFGSGANTAVPSFTFGTAPPSTAGSSAAGQSSAPFPFSSTTSSSAAPTGPTFGVGQAPAFGQSSGQPSAPAFGSTVPPLFSASASQPPAFGTGPSTTPMFGQQANATPAFGSTSASSAPGGGFQFGGASAFGSTGSAGGVFTFSAGTGASAAPSAGPAAPAQPSGGGFIFTQPPTFNIGTTKSSFTTSTAGQHSISGRKIKTAVRRRK
ncbi:nuclear pore complex protein Nup153 isoform X2 [Scleropages formosus]|uniref:nuclear pore complex protein Nup153 isoform X2 n=1 Tax=Scleropages formosus TaxID=113540 RepID=UPI000878EF12|nr:nuclear pore complex protein Nup153 isoform X2 [Scleropages formosus]